MSAPLSDEDKAFIRAILNNPAELTGWLAYIDWLDERDDPRAEFVRLEMRRGQLRRRDPDWDSVYSRLQELRTSLDPHWVAVFDRPAIENCDEEFAFKCPKQWEELKGTDNPRERYCETCDKKVYYCLTEREAQGRARLGLCVAVASAVRDSRILHVPHWERRGAVTLGVRHMPEREPEPEPPRRPWWKFW